MVEIAANHPPKRRDIMSRLATHPLQMDVQRNEPFVTQYEMNGISLSWNPDNNRFHIEDEFNGKVYGIHKHWRNAVALFKKISATQKESYHARICEGHFNPQG